MAQFECGIVGCVGNFLTLAGLREHIDQAHPTQYLCRNEHCGRVFGTAKGEEGHYENDHLHYMYACAACGHGQWSSRSTGNTHRAAHPDCKDQPTLQLRPGVGAFFKGKAYTGRLVGPVRFWDRKTRGEPLGDMAAMTMDQLKAEGRAAAAQAAELRRRVAGRIAVAGPSVAPIAAAGPSVVPIAAVAPVLPVAVAQAPLLGAPVAASVVAPAAPVVLPQGIFCTICDSADGQYERYDSVLLLCEHLAASHGNHRIVVEEITSNEEEDQGDLSDVSSD